MGEQKAPPASHTVALSIRADIVTIEMQCGDRYAARVLHDDLLDRLRSGEGVVLSLQQPPST